jgi:hypothetical protein
MNENGKMTPVDQPESVRRYTCDACGDILTGREDGISTLCRFCVPGWVADPGTGTQSVPE